jgi:hypothetical protein
VQAARWARGNAYSVALFSVRGAFSPDLAELRGRGRSGLRTRSDAGWRGNGWREWLVCSGGRWAWAVASWGCGCELSGTLFFFGGWRNFLKKIFLAPLWRFRRWINFSASTENNHFFYFTMIFGSHITFSPPILC